MLGLQQCGNLFAGHAVGETVANDFCTGLVRSCDKLAKLRQLGFIHIRIGFDDQVVINDRCHVDETADTHTAVAGAHCDIVHSIKARTVEEDAQIFLHIVHFIDERCLLHREIDLSDLCGGAGHVRCGNWSVDLRLFAAGADKKHQSENREKQTCFHGLSCKSYCRLASV